MKNEFKAGLQKAGEAVNKAGSAVGKATGKSAEAIKTAATGLAAKIKEENIKSKQKKLNPLFPAEYSSAEFHIPNLVVIVDDAVRRDNALCEGAVGWRSKVKEVEVLYLYDEFLPQSGLTFVPTATCDSAYYVDPHDRTRFIRVDCLFDRTQKEKLAELAHIAYCLGAKSYNVEMYEETSSKSSSLKSSKTDDHAGMAKLNAKMEQTVKSSAESVSKSLASVVFTESRTPVEPKLRWFVHDSYIREIIAQRCSGLDTMRSVDIILSGKDYATMSANTSVKVDAAVSKIGLNANTNIEASSSEERKHQLLFHLEF